ncbi:MAG: DUF4169 family protein [Paracoccaceae bacterium]
MNKPISLSRARKQKARANDLLKADRNAVRFGLTKHEKQQDIAQSNRSNILLEQHKIESDK